jgi:autotransporter-associated beta strand protein
LQLLEAYKAAYDPVSGAILTAAQDNATAIQPKPGSTVWQPTQSGDGFNLGVNATSLPGRSLLYFGANSASIKRFVVDQAGQPLAWANLDFQAGGKELAQHEGLANQGDLPLASQFVLNRVAPTQIALGTNRVYVGTDPLDMTSGPDVPIALTEIYRPAESRAQVMALAYGTNDNPGALLALYAGSQQPVTVSLAATPAPGTMTAAAWPDAANIPLAGVFDPRAARRFYIVDGAAVYGTDDGGVSFRNLRGNLPASFGNIRATEFLSNNGVNALLIGGHDASWNPGSPVYVAQATNLTSWSAFGNGLPNAVVDGLSYSTQGDVLVVATLGRGVYALYDVTSFFPTATVLSFGAANNDSTPIASQLTDGVDANGVPFSRGLVKSGSGTLTIRVSSTYTGPTSVNAGIMRAAAANVLANSSAFTVNAGAMLDLAGYDQTIGSLAGAGFVNLGQGVLTTGGDGSSTSFSGLIAGTGGLVKQGSGTFTLTGLNTYTGTTTVAEGTLALTADALVSGSVAVNSGATLGFGGAIGGALISAGTVTLPANGTRVSLGGSLMLLPGGTFSVPVTASGAAAGIQAGGAAQVAGALQLMPAQGAPALSDNAVLVAAGGVGGQFAAVTGGLPGMRFGLDYQSDRITLVPLPHGFVDLAQNGNQRAVATALNAMPDMPGKWQISNVLAAMPIQQVPAALQNLTGAGYTAFEQNAVSATHAFQDMVAGRLAGWTSGLPLDSASGAGAQTRVSSGRDPLGFGALLAAAGTVATDAVPVQSGTVAVRPWIASYGRFDHLSETSGAPGMRANGGAIVMGVDAPVGASQGIRAGLGAAFAYDFADISAEGLSGAYQQAYRGSLYGWAGIGAAWIGGSLDYAHVTEQATRSVGFGADTGSSRVTPSGNLVSGQVILARPVSVGGVQLMPQARLQTLNFTQNGFTEQGGTGAELSVSGRSRGDLRSVLGLSAAKSVALPDAGAVLTPQLALGWAHEFLDPAARLSAIFLEGGPGFTVSGANPGRDSVLAGAALSARFGNATLQLSYDVSAAAHETIQAVTGGVRMIW